MLSLTYPGSLGGLGANYFAEGLPSCDDVPAGQPCTLSDGTPVFLPSCVDVPAGTPCTTGAEGGGARALPEAPRRPATVPGQPVMKTSTKLLIGGAVALVGIGLVWTIFRA